MTDIGHDRIPAGYVRRAHGIGGDVVVRGMLQDADERFVVGSVLISDEAVSRSLEIEKVRRHQGDFIVSFAGITDRNAADALRGTQFTIDRTERRQLEAGEWWPEDLVGCTVVTREGASVGVITRVITGTAQDRIVVERTDGETAEVPFVESLVPEVDVEQERIVVDLPDGLFES